MTKRSKRGKAAAAESIGDEFRRLFETNIVFGCALVGIAIAQAGASIYAISGLGGGVLEKIGLGVIASAAIAVEMVGIVMIRRAIAAFHPLRLVLLAIIYAAAFTACKSADLIAIGRIMNEGGAASAAKFASASEHTQDAEDIRQQIRALDKAAGGSLLSADDYGRQIATIEARQKDGKWHTAAEDKQLTLDLTKAQDLQAKALKKAELTKPAPANIPKSEDGGARDPAKDWSVYLIAANGVARPFGMRTEITADLAPIIYGATLSLFAMLALSLGIFAGIEGEPWRPDLTPRALMARLKGAFAAEGAPEPQPSPVVAPKLVAQSTPEAAPEPFSRPSIRERIAAQKALAGDVSAEVYKFLPKH